MLPILELRGGLIAAAILDVNWFIAFPICVIGNMLFIPFVLLFIKKVFRFLKRFEKIGKWVVKLEERAHNKSKKIEKNKMIGLFSFVAIPLPGTGAWTGALVADVLGVRIKHSLPIITVGVIVAGLIISFISYVIPAWI
ncbi:MAG: small multi-drug export protein [Clostridia bacterium]|nr:small multi-drug export protein [Clostridia bacterium]